MFFSIAANASQKEFRVEMRRESYSSGGRTIHVETFAPAGTGRFPGVLVLHSAAGTLLGQGEMEDFSRRLAGRGTIAFLVRYFDRTGTIFAHDSAINKLSPLWVATVKDGVDFAAAHPRVRPDALGLCGYSLGGFVAVAEASRDSRIKVVATVGGGIFKGFRPKMQRVPAMLIVHGRMDKRVPVARAFELEKAARELGTRPEMKIYEREGHLFAPATRREAGQLSIDFLVRKLRAE